MTSASYDLIVIGGGPAGSSGANAAALFGKRVALVERAAAIGGAGFNTGTLPSKALRESALLISGWRARKLLGVDLSFKRETTVAELAYHAEHVGAAMRSVMNARIELLNVEVVHGSGAFADPHTVRVTEPSGATRLLRGEHILIATGSSPSQPAGFPFAHPRVHDSDQLLEITELPDSLAVVGAGVIGAEYACTFAALGVEVHLIDGRDSLLPFLDEEISAGIAGGMQRHGVQFHWKERVAECTAETDGLVRLRLSSGLALAVSDVLVAAGRTSNTTDLDLPAAGITAAERGLVSVNAVYQTAVPHIYAAGDVIGPPALAGTSVEQARVAVCHAFGVLQKEMAPLLPVGIYTIPEASMVGATEKAVRESGVPYLVGRSSYSHSPRGRLIGDESGLLKLIFRRDDLRLLGVHVIGEQATELVHVGLMAMLSEADADLFNRACFNYPTLGDLYKYAALDAIVQQRLGRTITVPH
jgi:NAD(P) transhydrogenase